MIDERSALKSTDKSREYEYKRDLLIALCMGCMVFAYQHPSRYIVHLQFKSISKSVNILSAHNITREKREARNDNPTWAIALISRLRNLLGMIVSWQDPRPPLTPTNQSPLRSRIVLPAHSDTMYSLREGLHVHRAAHIMT